MAVSTAYSPITVSWSSTNQAIPITWPFLTGTLVVTEVASTGVETTKSLTTHYTVSGGTDSNGLPSTGTVTMVGSATSGSNLRVTRSTSKTQAWTTSENDAFPQKSIEAALDKLTLVAQEGPSGGADDITGDVLQLDSSGAQDFWDGEGKPVRMSFLELTEATAPDTPASGYGRLYTKTDGDLYHKNDAGTEVNLSDAVATAAASAAAASTSETNAATSETNAATSATAAAASLSASSFKWNLDTSTSMADPGTGEVRFNNASWASVTAIAIADTSADTGNPDVSTVVLTWDDSTNTTHRGSLSFRKASAPAEFVTFSITGVSTDNSGWTQLAVTYVAGSPSWTAGDGLVAVFTRTGNAGADGEGAGDVVGPASSVDNEIALFDSTTGKLLKRASTTGILKATSGVIAAASAGTDYYAPSGTDVAVADGGTGASTASDARTNLGLVIGTDVQAYDAELAALAGLTSAADRVPYFTGSGSADLATLTSFARTLLDDADAATARTTLGITSSGITLGTSVATTSGTAIDFTGLPSGCKRIMLLFNGVSTNGTSSLVLQIGDAGGIETTGYASSVDHWAGGTGSATSAYELTAGAAAAGSHSGVVTLCHVGSNVWVEAGNVASGGYCNTSGGTKTLSAELDRVRVSALNGTDTFDAGSINIMYEV